MIYIKRFQKDDYENVLQFYLSTGLHDENVSKPTFNLEWFKVYVSLCLTGNVELLLGFIEDFLVCLGSFNKLDQNIVIIGRILVRSEYRNKGFGRVMLSKLEESAACMGFKILRVELLGFQNFGRRFYEYNGFRRILSLETGDSVVLQKDNFRSAAGSNSQDVIVSSVHPGGNILVKRLSLDMIELEQDMRDSNGDWFYWNFCVESCLSKRIIFKFTNGEVIGHRGPAVSTDGFSWQWLGEDEKIDRTSFAYDFHGDGCKVYFSFSFPYQLLNFEQFLIDQKSNQLLNIVHLTYSEQGRMITLLQIGNSKGNRNILLTCRHHACESTASYVLQGIITSLLECVDQSILDNYTFHVVPFVDVDGVENGDQGKNRKPHDHNRDYIESPRYKSTIAIQKYVKEKGIYLAIDFHSPWKWGEYNDYPFFVKKGNYLDEKIQHFANLLQTLTRENPVEDKLLFDTRFNLEKGKDWNQGGDSTFSYYVHNSGASLALTFEVPYFGIEAIVSQNNLIELGRDFAKALRVFLKEL